MTVGDGWAVEVKFDGIRLQLRRDGRAIRLRSRPGRDCTEEFPELAPIQTALGRHRVVLDGELVCLGADGAPDFASLRRQLRTPAGKARRDAERQRGKAGNRTCSSAWPQTVAVIAQRRRTRP